MADPTADDGGAARSEPPYPLPDAHGQAALLLVECLIHDLIARSVLSVADAVEIVGDAIDVGDELAHEPEVSPSVARRLPDILEAIQASLSIDLSASGRPRSPGQ